MSNSVKIGRGMRRLLNENKGLLFDCRQKDAEIERLTDKLRPVLDELSVAHVANRILGEKIERLEAKLTQDPRDARCQLYKATQRWQQEAERCNAEIERLTRLHKTVGVFIESADEKDFWKMKEAHDAALKGD